MKNRKRPNITERQLWRDEQKQKRSNINNSSFISTHEFEKVINALFMQGIISYEEYNRINLEGRMIIS